MMWQPKNQEHLENSTTLRLGDKRRVKYYQSPGTWVIQGGSWKCGGCVWWELELG
jgi:hypothetical protein